VRQVVTIDGEAYDPASPEPLSNVKALLSPDNVSLLPLCVPPCKQLGGANQCARGSGRVTDSRACNLLTPRDTPQGPALLQTGAANRAATAGTDGMVVVQLQVRHALGLPDRLQLCLGPHRVPPCSL
jgi:hypothetical protein